MKGIILAGGMGTRLYPLTKITNKHLLLVYNKPMIYYPLETLIKAGITQIMIITGPEYAGDFMSLLGSGIELGINLTYRIQDQPGGIAQALSMAEEFAKGERIAVILGDNIFSDDLAEPIRAFDRSNAGACLFLKAVPDAQRFGVAEIRGNTLISIEEKPKKPKSDYAVTGLYLYDGKTVFDVIKTLVPSARGELEITDVNNYYVQKEKAAFHVLGGEWSDAGTFESLYKAATFMRSKIVGK